jgi:hypothetical protein
MFTAAISKRGHAEYTDDRLAMFSSANIAILLFAKGQDN